MGNDPKNRVDRRHHGEARSTLRWLRHINLGIADQPVSGDLGQQLLAMLFDD
jgi:hypothetical protein